MDRVIEKTKTQRLIKHWPYVAGGIVILIIIAWLVFGNSMQSSRTMYAPTDRCCPSRWCRYRQRKAAS